MAERIKMACPCGATMETESNLIATVSDRQKWFQEAHMTCLQSQKEPQASETPSSPVTTRLEATSDTLSIFYSWSSLANQAGILPPSVQQAIKDSYSLPPHLGEAQAEVTLSIRIPKAATPPAGSPLPSTAEPTPVVNGAAGEMGHEFV